MYIQVFDLTDSTDLWWGVLVYAYNIGIKPRLQIIMNKIKRRRKNALLHFKKDSKKKTCGNICIRGPMHPIYNLL